MALPQCAMAHFGSRVEASAKVFSDSGVLERVQKGEAFFDRGLHFRGATRREIHFAKWPEAAKLPEPPARATEGPARRAESKSAQANKRCWSRQILLFGMRNSNSTSVFGGANSFDCEPSSGWTRLLRRGYNGAERYFEAGEGAKAV